MVETFKDGGLGDGQCHIALNSPECCFDGGDCVVCPTCPDSKMVNDGVCDLHLMTEECCYDHGDCDPDFVNSACFKNCHVPGLNEIQLKYFLTNGICDHPLNKADCCFDNGECLGVAEDCKYSCPSNTTRLGDGICDEDLNNIMCCYDIGDCPYKVKTDIQLPPHCVTDTCFVQNYGDGICDKDVDGQICCNDRFDCIDTTQKYEDVPCSRMSTWTLFDTCPLCCRSNASFEREPLMNVCPEDLMNPECCYGNCLELLSTCPTCQVKDYLLNINDGICDDFLNNQECCFDFEDCVLIEYLNYVPRFDKRVGALQKKLLLDTKPEIDFEVSGLLSNQFCDKTFVDCYSQMIHVSNFGRGGGGMQCDSSCPYPNDRIGDHICDEEIYAEKFCCHDKGDCSLFDVTTTKEEFSLCPTCPEERRLNLRDGICDESNRNEECCFDLGDCTPEFCTIDTIIEQAVTAGEFSDNNRAFFLSLKHQTDGFGFNELIGRELGDRVCNQLLNSPHCYYDGWDCKTTLCSTCNVVAYTNYHLLGM